MLPLLQPLPVGTHGGSCRKGAVEAAIEVWRYLTDRSGKDNRPNVATVVEI